ncbi:PLP-dependent transferase [Microthyrium microscopicum]|uniref:aromatic-amino-acid transaminase n=1 Tax=Microthyrium microscopicum TaxID=703497 RepID=A0A6A6USX2_9PEZI|nr:PLP-dependent transferase [Microthyrium microscopicum]
MAPPAAIEVEAMTDTQSISQSTPTTFPHKTESFYRRRAPTDNEPKSQWGTAAPATSAQFKHSSTKGKPLARRWDDLLTPETKARKGSTLKAAAGFLSRPGIVSLGGGLPSSSYFPFAQLSVTVPAPGAFSERETSQSGVQLSADKHSLQTGQSIFDISTGLNYGQGHGAAQLLRWVTEHTELVHAPPYADWGCNLTIGSTSAIDMALRMFCAPGDAVLAEAYTFPTFVEASRPMGLRTVGVPMDEQGLEPGAVDGILEHWNPAAHGGARKPRVLYTVPTGQNPTGATMGEERRRMIYEVCCKHDVYILEDEPYYFLQLPTYDADATTQTEKASSHADFLAGLIPSFLSMDVQGRVMRMDSFSKVIAPGSRVGWVTGSEQIMERYKTHVDCSTQGPSGFSQIVLFKLLEEHWGHGGYLDWCKYIRSEYTERRDVIVRACEKHLPRDIVSWVAPKAGMFHWMKVDWKKHPLAASWTHQEIEEQIFMAGVDHGSLVTCGSWFYADDDVEEEQMFFRATYAAAPFDQIDLAIQRFGEALRDVFGLQNQIEEL